MKTVFDIIEAIKKLTDSELVEFRRQFDGLDADQWDRQFEHDATVGRLDRFAKMALDETRNSISPLTPSRAPDRP